MRIQNKVVWITGASSGIGEALACAMAKGGAKLILSARREAELERVKQRCVAESGAQVENIVVAPLDLAAGSATLEEKAAEAARAFGGVDIVVHNGGVSQRSLAKDTSSDVVRRVMEIDFFGAVALTGALLPAMLSRREGHIVVVSSLVGKFGTPLRSAYSAAKHALHGYFDSLRAEVWRENIRVTMICPGFIRTNVSVNALKGDGGAHGAMDDAQAQGMSADECARRIIRAIENDALEVYIGGKETLGVHIKRFFPSLFARVLRKAKVT